jgi:hypothetical protein
MTFPEVAECPMTQVMTETGYLHRKILGLDSYNEKTQLKLEWSSGFAQWERERGNLRQYM